MSLQGATSCHLKTTTGSAIKCTMEYYRKDTVSEEAFMHWFTNKFLPRAVAIMKKHNILKFEVEKTDIQVGAAFQAEMDQMQHGWKVNDCDLVLEYWVYDLEYVRNLVSDSEWIQTALKDENDWLDASRSTIRIGYNTTYLGYGTLMNIARQNQRGRVSAGFD